MRLRVVTGRFSVECMQAMIGRGKEILQIKYMVIIETAGIILFLYKKANTTFIIF